MFNHNLQRAFSFQVTTATARDRLRSWLKYLALPGLLILGALRDIHFLFRYPVAVGLDGYYYVLQVESLRTHGRLFFPTDTPLILGALTAAYYAINDAPLSIKICSVILHLSLSAGVFAMIISLSRSLWLGLLGAAVTQLSQLHLFMIADYINNLGSLGFLSWASWSMVRAYQTRAARWLVLASLFFGAAIFSHKSALGLALAFLVLGGLALALTSDRMNRWVRFSALLVIITLWITPRVIAAAPNLALPDWLRREVSSSFHWPFEIIGYPEGLISILVSLPILFLLIGPMNSKVSVESRVVLGSLALWCLIVALNPFLNGDPGLLTISGRLGYLAYVAIAILLPGLIWLVWRKQKRTVPYVIAPVLPLVLLSLLSALPMGLRPEYLERRARLVKGLPAILNRLGSKPIIIAPHGDEFLVTHTLGVLSQHTLPRERQDRTVFWLLDHFNRELLSPSVAVVMDEKEGEKCVVLIEDAELQHLLRSMSENQRRRLLAANPFYRNANQNGNN